MKSRIVPPDYEVSIFGKPCPNCKSPIFFGYKRQNPVQVECGKCHTKVGIVYRRGKFEVASIVNTDSIVIKCNNPECGKVFVLDRLEEQLCSCPYCGKKFYVKITNPGLHVKPIPSYIVTKK